MDVIIQISVSAIAMARVDAEALIGQITDQVRDILQCHPDTILYEQLKNVSATFRQECPELDLEFIYQTTDRTQDRTHLTVREALNTQAILCGNVDTSNYGDYMKEKFCNRIH